MPQLLTRVRPNRARATSVHHPAVSNAKSTRPHSSRMISDEKSGASNLATAKSHLQAVAELTHRVDRAHIGRPETDELLLLATTQNCLESVRASGSAGPTAIESQTSALLNELKNQKATKPVTPAAKSGNSSGTRPNSVASAPISRSLEPRTQPAPAQATSAGDAAAGRVQLRLSKSLIKLLAAFHKAGQRPGAVIESTMWRDSRIRDAASILGLEIPGQSGDQKKNC